MASFLWGLRLAVSGGRHLLHPFLSTSQPTRHYPCPTRVTTVSHHCTYPETAAPLTSFNIFWLLSWSGVWRTVLAVTGSLGLLFHPWQLCSYTLYNPTHTLLYLIPVNSVAWHHSWQLGPLDAKNPVPPPYLFRVKSIDTKSLLCFAFCHSLRTACATQLALAHFSTSFLIFSASSLSLLIKCGWSFLL